MLALRRASLSLRNQALIIRASSFPQSDSTKPQVSYKQEKVSIRDKAFERFHCRELTSATLFRVNRSLSFQASEDPSAWEEETPPNRAQEENYSIEEAEAETKAAKLRAARQLIKKMVNSRMKEGKRTRARSVAYETFHRLAQSEHNVLDVLVEAVENVKPVCQVEKVGMAGTIYDVPAIVSKGRQERLAIRWILDAASKRRGSHKVSLEKCLVSEILDAYGRRGHARSKRDALHKLASNNRGFAHFRWW